MTNVEWYTPPEILEPVKQLLGTIELDPASCWTANLSVGASIYFSGSPAPLLDGLQMSWLANTVWCNPPYGREHNRLWAEKVLREWKLGHFNEGLYLCPASTGAEWFCPLMKFPQCFVHGRISFLTPNGEVVKGNRYDSCITYFGWRTEEFAKVFSSVGTIKVSYE